MSRTELNVFKLNPEFPISHGYTLPMDLQTFFNRKQNKLRNGRKITENAQKNFAQQEVIREVGVSPNLMSVVFYKGHAVAVVSSKK